MPESTTTYETTYLEQLRLAAEPDAPQPAFDKPGDIANHLRLMVSHVGAALKGYDPDDPEGRQHLTALLVMVGNEARAGAEYLGLLTPSTEAE